MTFDVCKCAALSSITVTYTVVNMWTQFSLRFLQLELAQGHAVIPREQSLLSQIQRVMG